MENYHLKEMAEALESIPDDHEFTTNGKQYEDSIIGLLNFCDELLKQQRWKYEFIYGLRKREEPNPFYGTGTLEELK